VALLIVLCVGAEGGQLGHPSAGVLAPASPNAVRRLALARVAVEQERYVEAANAIQELLSHEVEDGFTGRSEGTATHSTLKSEAARLLDQMPSQAHKWYELQFGAVAQRLLDEAIDQGDREALAQLSVTYFHTEAGCHATLLLARDRLDCGRPREALAWLRRLDESPAAARRCQPELALLSTVSWILLDERAKAHKVVEGLGADDPSAIVRIGDEQLEAARDADHIVRLLERAREVCLRSPAAGGQWRMFRGDAARNAQSDWEGILGDLSWHVKMGDDDSGEERSEESTTLPALHPLAVSGEILARSPTGRLLAIEAASGRQIWEYSREWSNGPSDNTAGRGVVILGGRIGPQQRRRQEALFGQFSSDGRHVYLVDGLGTVRNDAVARRFGAAPPHNRLVALSQQRQGAVVWTVGDADGEDEPELAGVLFLGAPVCDGTRLYALAEIGGEIALAALQADSGRLKWWQPLAQPDLPIAQDWRRRQTGCTPSMAEGVVVCPASAGVVVAVDALTGRLLWGYRYPRASNAVGQTLRFPFGRGTSPSAKQIPQGWVDASATIAEGRLLLTPIDSDELLCLDLHTGKLEWAWEGKTMLFVACVRQGKVVLVGETEITALNLVDGSSVWPATRVALPSGAKPSGRGFDASRFYYLPTDRAEILKVDLADGRLVERIETPSVPGNLIGLKDRLIWQSAEGVYQFSSPGAAD